MTHLQTCRGSYKIWKALLANAIAFGIGTAAHALPFTQAVSGGPVDVTCCIFEPIEIGRSPVVWQGPIPPASELNGIPVRSTVTINADFSGVGNFTGDLSFGTGYILEFAPQGVGVFISPPVIEDFFGISRNIIAGEAFSFRISETVETFFTMDIDPLFDFAGDFLFDVAVFASGQDFQGDDVIDPVQNVSFEGFVTVGAVPAPEPAAFGLLASSLAALLVLTRRRRRT